MTDLIDVVQSTELDDSYVELFDILLNTKPTATEVHLIDGLEEGTTNIWFPKYNSSGNLEWSEYLAVPIGIDGIEAQSTGAAARPTLSIANIAALARNISNFSNYDQANSDGEENETTIDDILADLNITKNEDVLGSSVTYRRTLLKNTYVKISDSYYTYSDRETKTTAITSVPVPKEFPSSKYILDRVSLENNILVEFELASPFDIEGFKIPNRYVIGKYCPWEYKGADLGTTAKSVRSGCSWRPHPTNGPFFDAENNVTTAANDACGKTIQSCKKRFHNSTNGDESIPLPFGGFPGTRKFK
tara:strand:+ start:8943 stop:9851 length:909 start_codon:yes stop_codon:yes gene_type:complete